MNKKYFCNTPIQSAMLFLTLIIVSFYASGARLSNKNELTLEGRLFDDDQQAFTEDNNFSLFLRSALTYSRSGFKSRFRAYGRAGLVDQERNIAVIEDAWLAYKFESWYLKVGAEVQNWTATEAFHPADIINSQNLDSNLENPEKLGEPIISAEHRVGTGKLSLFILPYQMETVYGPDSSRLSGLGENTEIGDALWFDGKTLEEAAVSAEQWGIRFTQTLGGADFALHYLEHYDRLQPLFLSASSNPNMPRPVYFKSQNAGLTYAHVIDAAVLKLEYNYKDFVEQEEPVFNAALGGNLALSQADHSQLALGLEYNIFHDSGTETALYLEGQGIFGVDDEVAQTLSVFQKDVFIGVRHALNDVMGREIFAFVIVDAEDTSDYMYNFRYQQRLSDIVTLQLGLRIVESGQRANSLLGLHAIERSDHVFINLTCYF